MRQGCQGSQGMVGGSARGPAEGVPECTPLDSALARRQQASSFPRNPMPAATDSMAWCRGLGALSRIRWWLAPCVPCKQCTRCTSRKPHVCSYCFCIRRAAETSWVLSPGVGGYRLQDHGAVTWVCFLGVGFLPVGQQWSWYTLAGMSECGQRWEAF